jgi:hypothetical protein
VPPQTVKPEQNELEDSTMNLDISEEVETPPVHFLCPPRELAECIFRDDFVFPPSQVATSTFHFKNTVDSVFTQFVNLGLYARGKGWTNIAKAPNFVGEHTDATETSYADFVNELVSRAVEVTGIKPSVKRTWSAANSLKKLAGSPENRKPDVLAIDAKCESADWRVVDSIMEIKSSRRKNVESFSQLSERARTLFGIQDDRRCVLQNCHRAR